MRPHLLHLVLATLFVSSGLTALAAGPLAPEPHLPGTPVLDEALTVAALEGLPDPSAWLVDPSTGQHYRRATAQERAHHAWDEGTFLVEAGSLAATSEGAAEATLLVPLADGVAHAVPLRLVDSRDAVTYTAVLPDGTVRTTRPVVHTYGSPELAETGAPGAGPAAALVAAEGGFYARAVVGGLQVEMLGPDPARRLDLVPSADLRGVAHDEVAVAFVTLLPGGEQPDGGCGILQFLCDALLGREQCRDGVDNDGDRWVDMNDPGCSSQFDDSESDSRRDESLILQGEGKWCTRTGTANWIATLNTIGSDIQAGYDGNGGVRANVFHSWSTCWFFSSLSDAQTCDRSGGCTIASGTDSYPFNGCNGQAACYRDRAWTNVAKFRQHINSGIPAQDLAQVIHDGTMSSNTLCGLASFTTTGGLYDASSSGPLPTGDSVSAGIPKPSNCVNFIPTHETGHNYDGTHGNARQIGGCLTVLATGSATPSCRHNYFSDGNRLAVNACAIDRSATCPRSGTG